MRRPASEGFTLVELIMVLVLVGILSVFVLPRLLDKTMDERGLHDAAKAALQHARRVAVAQRRYVCVTVTAGSGPAGVLALSIDPTVRESVATVTCSTALALPSPGRGCAASHQVCAPQGVSLGGSASLIFDPLGRLVGSGKSVAGSPATLTVSNQPDITVQPETGYIQ